MKFQAEVEPPEPMKGLVVPDKVMAELVEQAGEKRPRIIITINGHTWQSRVAIMRGRNLIGLSNANRRAAGVETGDKIKIEVEFDPDPPVLVEPEDFVKALDADPVARAAYDRLSNTYKRSHVLDIEGAKRPETRARRIEKALAALREQ